MRNKRKFAIIDANYNRAREGLRVAEDIERFYYRLGRFAGLRRLRHRLAAVFRDDYPQLVGNRNVKKDRGAKLGEKGRGGMKAVLRSNFARAGEALRVLEEVEKTEDVKKSAAVKRIRFRLYELEKEFLEEGGKQKR